MTNQIETLIETRATAAQRATVNRMRAAPAMKWVVSKVFTATLLGVKCEGVAVQIEAPAARMWGVVLPNGEFIKPKPGRKTIDAADIAFKL